MSETSKLDEIYEQLEKEGCKGNPILFERAALAIAESQSLKQSLEAQTRIADELQQNKVAEKQSNEEKEKIQAKKDEAAAKAERDKTLTVSNI